MESIQFVVNYQFYLAEIQQIIKLELQTVKSIISKGFTHFKRKAGIDENKCFKDLRPTYQQAPCRIRGLGFDRNCK